MIVAPQNEVFPAEQYKAFPNRFTVAQNVVLPLEYMLVDRGKSRRFIPEKSAAEHRDRAAEGRHPPPPRPPAAPPPRSGRRPTQNKCWLLSRELDPEPRTAAAATCVIVTVIRKP